MKDLTKNIEEFNSVGATVVNEALDENDLIAIKTGIHDNIENPSPMFDSFEENSTGETLFFNDFNNWRRLQSIKNIVMSPKICSIAKKLLITEKLYLFHDHVIVKKKGTSKETPWHIDSTYFMVDGPKTISIWIPLCNLSKDQSLIFAEGSHKDKNKYMPKSFKNKGNLEKSGEFIDFDDSYINKNYNLISWDMNIGDVLAFTYDTFHMAPAYEHKEDRLSISVRYFGDNCFFDGTVENPAPPFVQMGYQGKHGEKLSDKWFPEITNEF